MPTRIVTVSELNTKLGALMAELEEQGVPLYMTQYGKPKTIDRPVVLGKVAPAIQSVELDDIRANWVSTECPGTQNETQD